MRSLDWSDLKPEVDAGKVQLKHFTINNSYLIEAYDGTILVADSVIKKTTPRNNDQIDFEDNGYKDDSNKKIAKLSPNSQRPEVSVVEAEGNFKAYVTHDFTDKTTWYCMSQRIEGETLNLETGKTYKSTQTHWIDLVNGKVTREDEFSSGYKEKIYDNGTELTYGDDYTVDYVAGKITLDANYTPTGPITADFSYATTSEFIMKPNTGKMLRIEHTELDFTVDVQMSCVHFQVWVYDPQNLPNKMQVAETTYKNEKDILKIANAVTHITKWGALQNDVKRAEFQYARTIDLKDSIGTEMRIVIKDNQPFPGEWGSATLYTTEEDEIT